MPYTADQINDMSADERRELFNTWGRVIFETERFGAALRRRAGLKSQSSITKYRNGEATIPTLLLVLMQEWVEQHSSDVLAARALKEASELMIEAVSVMGKGLALQRKSVENRIKSIEAEQLTDDAEAPDVPDAAPPVDETPGIDVSRL